MAGRGAGRPGATSVADRMVDALTLSGTRDDVAERITAYDGLADSIKLTPPTHGLARSRDPGRPEGAASP